MRVIGYLSRNNPVKDIYFSGTVIERYTVKVHGFDLPMVKVMRDCGRIAYTHASHVVPE